MKFLLHILILTLFAGLYSCKNVMDKTENTVHTIKTRAKQESNKIADKISEKLYPPFDSDKPDTENNKKRFADFLKIPITPNIKNIYCFDDAIGIDADYMFAFNCEEATSDNIIKTHALKKDTTNSDNGFSLQHDFFWWDKTKISTLEKYSWTDGEQYWKYYWYDSIERKAYFFDFDL